MPKCSNCGSNVPLKKGIAGRPLAKEDQDRECPDCGKSLGPEDSGRSNSTLMK